MRLRNIKGAKTVIESSEYIVKEPETHKGKYKKLFNNNNPIHLEIGTGKGDFIINMALKYPNINFIGIEKYDSVLIKALEKIDNINNLLLIRIDANDIEKLFKNEIEVLYLNFSDPWPKNRHEHRRLTSCQFLTKYDKIFIDKKTIIQKTDNRTFFEYSIMSFNNYGYRIEELSLDLYNDNHDNNVETEYEKKFVSKGNLIYRTKVTK